MNHKKVKRMEMEKLFEILAIFGMVLFLFDQLREFTDSANQLWESQKILSRQMYLEELKQRQIDRVTAKLKGKRVPEFCVLDDQAIKRSVEDGVRTNPDPEHIVSCGFCYTKYEQWCEHEGNENLLAGLRESYSNSKRLPYSLEEREENLLM